MFRPYHLFLALPLLFSCAGGSDVPQAATVPAADTAFQWEVDQFEDLRILRYQIPGWDMIPLQQKKLAYYLTMSGLAGRDIMWDQNYRHNLKIRRAVEAIVTQGQQQDDGAEWEAFLTYAKQMWFANGIHHHYSNQKFIPGFSRQWFEKRLAGTDRTLSPEVLEAIFDPTIDAVKVNQDTSKDLVLGSAVNFYGEDVSEKEVVAFYAGLKNPKDPEQVSHGLNSKVVRGPDGKLKEQRWMVGGMYNSAIERVVFWLEKAREVALNAQQEKAIGLLIKYYQTGDLKTWDEFNIEWVKDTESDIDFIHGFVEVYQDPLGLKGSYEVIVQMKDPVASQRMSVLMDNAQWFEENSPIRPEHKRKDVVGITYNFINVVGEAGDASPSTPVGVNLPNANWIRAKHGSKSVSLGNISEAYEKASGGEMMKEFGYDEGERERAKKHGALAGKLHTALHEVIGHASGVMEPGKDPDALKNYASPLEEARADLVGLYYIMDPRMVEIGLMEDLEVARAQYEGYLRNGLMLQLRRLKLGSDVQQAHMRNRQLVSRWVLEKGAADSTVYLLNENGKTYVRIGNYERLRELFGELLSEVQRIKSQGDYAAGQKLVETYGVKVDQALHAEVLKRSENIKTAPYSGFVNPVLEPVEDESGNITDIKVVQPKDFISQMLDYGKRFSFLQDEN
jgi:dipeptidyl-peptidase III